MRNAFDTFADINRIKKPVSVNRLMIRVGKQRKFYFAAVF